MADKSIGQLPEISEVSDNSLLPVESSGTAYHTTGAAWKQFVQDAVSAPVATATQAATNAGNSATAAAGSASTAEAAAAAILGMQVTSEVQAAGTTPTLSRSESGGVVTLHFGLAPGAQGPQGVQGPAGPQGDTQIINYTSNYYTASVQPGTGSIYFDVDNSGHLILTYAGDTAPDYSIDFDSASNTYGHLLWNVS
ncbi:MAG: hypothetical protein J6Y20_01075 [Lachnospiraceae bacterium]|nr:hypothetical protein [Lachnospiraceae bacterium]